MKILWRVCVPLLLSTIVLGHGGILLMTGQAGPFRVSLFAADAPLRVGSNDLSLLVQSVAEDTPLLDTKVELQLDQHGEQQIRVTANPSGSANRMLYAAPVNLSAPGAWSLHIFVERSGAKGSCVTPLHIEPAQPPLAIYWPYFAVVPAGIGLFALNQQLKKRRQNKRP